MRIRHIVIGGFSGLLYFPTISHKRHDIGYKMCFDLIYSVFYLKYFSFYEEMSEI